MGGEYAGTGSGGRTLEVRSVDNPTLVQKLTKEGNVPPNAQVCVGSGRAQVQTVRRARVKIGYIVRKLVRQQGGIARERHVERRWDK